MNTILKDKLIKDYENSVNNRINTLYDTFYIQPYYSSTTCKYGAILNGEQIALCEDLRELEQIINTIIYFLDRGGLKK
jgi:hypothetical protein